MAKKKTSEFIKKTIRILSRKRSHMTIQVSPIRLAAHLAAQKAAQKVGYLVAPKASSLAAAMESLTALN